MTSLIGEGVAFDAAFHRKWSPVVIIAKKLLLSLKVALGERKASTYMTLVGSFSWPGYTMPFLEQRE